jgi:hypothetical protein
MTLDNISPTLTDEQKGRIYGILAVGCDRQTAADYIGCSLADLRNMMQRDSAFAKDVRRAEAEIELKHMNIVQETARDKKEWRASVWWLERRSPERFGRRTAGAVTARQLKAYIAVLCDLLREGIPNDKERQTIIDRLNALADDVDKILRDDQFPLGDLLEDPECPASDEAAEAESDDSADGPTNLHISHWT